MQCKEIWSPEDEQSLANFEHSLQLGDLAGTLLAIEGASARGRADCRSYLRELGQRVAELEVVGDARARLAQVLVEQEHFRGDDAHYFAPRNSFLSHVLERRRGLPILLSSVWMLTGQEAGVSVQGLGLPGHFIVRIDGNDGALVDPFAGGRTLTVQDCSELVQQLSGGSLDWSDRYLAPYHLVQLLDRVMRNLMHSYRRLAEPENLLRIARFAAALHSDEPEPRLMHARLAEALGGRALALESYQAILERFKGTPAAQFASERAIALEGEQFLVD